MSWATGLNIHPLCSHHMEVQLLQFHQPPTLWPLIPDMAHFLSFNFPVTADTEHWCCFPSERNPSVHTNQFTTTLLLHPVMVYTALVWEMDSPSYAALLLAYTDQGIISYPVIPIYYLFIILSVWIVIKYAVISSKILHKIYLSWFIHLSHQIVTGILDLSYDLIEASWLPGVNQFNQLDSKIWQNHLIHIVQEH